MFWNSSSLLSRVISKRDGLTNMQRKSRVLREANDAEKQSMFMTNRSEALLG